MATASIATVEIPLAAVDLHEVVAGIEELLDAHAAQAIDLCPALERLLLDVLELAAEHADD